MTCARFVLAALLLAALTARPVSARAADTEEQLHSIEATLDQQKRKQAELDRQAAENSAALNDLRRQLIAATEALTVRQNETQRLEDRLEELARDIEDKQAALDDERQKQNVLMGALIELGRQPPASLLWREGPTSDYIRRSVLLRDLLPRIRERADGIAQDLATLDELKDQMKEQKRLTMAARTNLAEQRHGLDRLIQMRQGYLRQTESEKEALASRLAALAGQARDLRQLLDEVSPPRTAKPSRATKPAPGLRWPVSGAMARRFGDRDRDGVKSQGIAFAALPDAPVTAPADGKVVFSGPFKGYGKIIILQHDGGTHSFLAGLGRIDAQAGQEVEAGEPLGVMPSANGKHELYFEWRRNAEPVDPASGIRR